MVTLIRKIGSSLYRKIKQSIELNRYNDFTIAEYFRRQGAVIGENTRLEIRTLGPEPYLIRIGNHCTIAPGVGFICHDGATWIFTEKHPSLQKFGTVNIKDNCFIGINALILGNVTIGPNAIVGACSVVTKDVPPNTVVAGNPARVVSTIEKYKEKALSIWSWQKPPDYFSELVEGDVYPPAYIQQMKMKELDKLQEHLVKVCWQKAREKETGSTKERTA